MKERDELILKLAEYTVSSLSPSQETLNQAKLCLYDALGCALAALEHPACHKILGPLAPECVLKQGVRVPGTKYILDPVQAAFNLGAMIRWLDYNDTFLAKEWAHPSDNLGGLIPLLDYLSRFHKHPILVEDLLIALIKAYEIQGALALENSFNKIGFDHVILVKVATAAVATHLLGGDQQQVYDAISQAFVDVAPLRTYRHAPNTNSRKSWAAGDATSRGVQLAFLTMRGEKGFKTALSARKWGLEDVLFKGKKLKLSEPLNSYIVNNILFKVGFPAEFHAQTAIEAAIQLHPKLKDQLSNIESIEIETHEAALKIIDKQGPLKSYADRDHCMQYMVAVALLYGEITPHSYSDEFAKNKKIDHLRAKIHLRENRKFSQDYLNPQIRSIANKLTISLKNQVNYSETIEFPLGHKNRRSEAIPLLYEKFNKNIKILNIEKQTNIKNNFFVIKEFESLIELFI